MKVAVYGNSHAALLSKELASIIPSCVHLTTYCKRGGKVESFPLPVEELSQLKESDILFLLPFGNEMLARRIRVQSNPKFIHLLECFPTAQNKLNRTYHHVRTALSSLKCRIFLIDNIYRHVECKQAFLFFKRQNKVIREVFSGMHNLEVIDHRKLLQLRGKLLKDRHQYSQLLRDGVHLHPRSYRNMSISLAKLANLL